MDTHTRVHNQTHTHACVRSHACTQTRSCSYGGVRWQARGPNNFLRFVMWNPAGILHDRKQRPRHRGGLLPLSHAHPLYYFVLQWWKEVCASQRPASPNYFNTGLWTGSGKVDPPAAFSQTVQQLTFDTLQQREFKNVVIITSLFLFAVITDD